MHLQGNARGRDKHSISTEFLYLLKGEVARDSSQRAWQLHSREVLIEVDCEQIVGGLCLPRAEQTRHGLCGFLKGSD